MKWCVQFPEEDILIKRPCLKRACGGNKVAATFLSYLLYQVSISQEYKKTAENINKRKASRGEALDEEITINVFRTQLEIVAEMDNEMSDRTLRDTAIPWLMALGYIEVDVSHPINIYAVHLDRVQKGIHYPPTETEVKQAQERFIAFFGKTSDDKIQGKTSVSKGKTSDDKEKLPFQREKLPTQSGKTSDGKKGIQRSPQAISRSDSEKDKSYKNNYESITIEENPRMLANANDTLFPTPPQLDEVMSEERTIALEAVREQQVQRATTQFQQPAAERATQQSPSSRQASSGASKLRSNQAYSSAMYGGRGKRVKDKHTPSKSEIALTLLGQHILDLYQQFKGRKVMWTEDTIVSANKLGDFIERDEDFVDVLKAIAADDFLKRKKVRWDLDYVYRKYDEYFDIVERSRGKGPPGANEAGAKTDYNDVMGMTDEQRAEYAQKQREKPGVPGVDREVLMKMPPEERIAYLRRFREREQEYPAAMTVSA